MARFGKLHRKYRKDLGFTQWELYGELSERSPGYDGFKGGSIVSKWETGKRMPSYETIKVLEKILGMPSGLLAIAAGYHLPGAKAISDESPGLQERRENAHIRQMKHIGELQVVAKAFIDALPEFPDLNKVEELDNFYHALSRLFRRLTGDVNWPSISDHINLDVAEIEEVSRNLDPLLFPIFPMGESRLVTCRQSTEDAWQLVPSIYVALTVIAESSDTREWAFNGLKQRCSLCADEAPEVDVRDYTADYEGILYVLKIPQNADVPESWRQLMLKQKGLEKYQGPKVYLDYHKFLPPGYLG